MERSRKTMELSRKNSSFAAQMLHIIKYIMTLGPVGTLRATDHAVRGRHERKPDGY